jgi:hypothetical protein
MQEHTYTMTLRMTHNAITHEYESRSKSRKVEIKLLQSEEAGDREGWGR